MNGQWETQWKEARESWRQRGYDVSTTHWYFEVSRGAVDFIRAYFREDWVGVQLVWPMKLEAAFAYEDFGDNVADKAIAKINEWLDTLDGAESGEIVRRIVELGNALQTVPLSPDIVKHRAAVEAMEHLTKRLLGGDGA